MGLFVAIAETMNHEKFEQYRQEHFDYLKPLQEAGKLVAAGPFGDRSGAMFVFLAGSKDEADLLAANDSLHLNGVRRYTLREWLPVRLFAWELRQPGLAGLARTLTGQGS